MSVFCLKCPNCGIELEAEEQYVGRKVVCSECEFRFVIQKEDACSASNIQQIANISSKQTKTQKNATNCLWCGILTNCPICKLHKENPINISVHTLLPVGEECSEDKAFRLFFNSILVYEYLLRKIDSDDLNTINKDLSIRMFQTLKIATELLELGNLNKNCTSKHAAADSNISKGRLCRNHLCLGESFEKTLMLTWSLRQQLDLEIESGFQYFNNDKFVPLYPINNLYKINVEQITSTLYKKTVILQKLLLNEEKFLSSDCIKAEILSVISQMPLEFPYEKKELRFRNSAYIGLMFFVIATYVFCIVTAITDYRLWIDLTFLTPIFILCFGENFLNSFKIISYWLKGGDYNAIRKIRFIGLLKQTIKVTNQPSQYQFPVDGKQKIKLLNYCQRISSYEYKIFKQYQGEIGIDSSVKCTEFLYIQNLIKKSISFYKKWCFILIFSFFDLLFVTPKLVYVDFCALMIFSSIILSLLIWDSVGFSQTVVTLRIKEWLAKYHKTSDMELFSEEDDIGEVELWEENETKPEFSPRNRLAALLKKVEGKDDTDNIKEKQEPLGNSVVLPVENKKEPMSVSDVGKTIVQKGDRNANTVLAYTLPPVSMLSKGNDDIGESPETIQQNVLTIQRTLDSFGVSGKVVGHTIGPRTTRYEISLANGVNINKFMRLENTFAMKLGVSKISLLSSLPRTDCVGIEIPNTHPQTVFMRNVMETKQWKKSEAVIPVVIGKNFSNEPVVIDLAQAPHLLIAGSTGSGKSVCLDTLIISLLFEFSPDELQLIMFDPNLIDFVNYSRLPHLVTPVINDAQKVPGVLRWAVTEMENRYKNLARAGVKKLAEFNALSKDGTPIRGNDGQIIADNFGNPVTRMPLLIIIINEFAEMYNHGFWIDAETYIDRITKLGRAAGVHIVMATQRPSADIISGKIKANFPARIAFRVPQNIDSRVILDQPGAEKLFGGGDMLAKLPGVSGLERIQGALVEDRDITAVTKFVSDQRPQNFAKGIVDDEEISDKDEFNSFSGYGSIDDDDIFDDMDKAEIAPLIKKYMQPGDDETMRRALEVVILERKASTSYIQRRLKIGYNRAAELIDIMEERGIISPPSGSGNKRGILIFDGIEINE